MLPGGTNHANHSPKSPLRPAVIALLLALKSRFSTARKSFLALVLKLVMMSDKVSGCQTN